MQDSPATNHTIVAVDMADFTNLRRTDQHRRVMRHGLDEMLRTAFTKAGVPWELCYNEDRGDGKMILIPPDIPRVTIFEQLPSLLFSGLMRHNDVYQPAAHIQLRMAVHSGDVGGDDTGKVGTALNDTFRIVDDPQVKAELRDSSGVLALAVSELVYNQVIAPDPAMEPGRFRKFVVGRNGMRAWSRIYGSVAEQSQVLPLLSDDAESELRELLTGLAVARLAILRARVLGQGTMPMPGTPDAWDVAYDLLDRNAEPGGLPRVLTFVELLASEVDAALGARLRRWNDIQAIGMRQQDAVNRLRAEFARSTEVRDRVHLVIAIEPDMFDDDRYLVTHWRQDDPTEWPPACGRKRNARLVDLEQVIDDLIMAAENAWATYGGDVGLEFVLPRTLLHLPVEKWSRELGTGAPSPLTLHYPIVVRSLERMLSPYWQRVWHAKWQVLVGPPPGGQIYVPTSADVDQPHRIAAALQDPQFVTMVLSKAPGPEPAQHDELREALRAGVPVVLWTRVDVPDDELKTVLAQLVEHGTFGDLPKRVQVARREALASSDQQIHTVVVMNLVILWDDPARPVYLDQSHALASIEGDADDRERAS